MPKLADSTAKDTEIVLMPVKAGYMYDEQTAAQLRDLIQNAKFGSGVFETNDCRAPYGELKAKGVEFMSDRKNNSMVPKLYSKIIPETGLASQNIVKPLSSRQFTVGTHNVNF